MESEKRSLLPDLPQRWNAPPRNRAAKWFFHGQSIDEKSAHPPSHPWYTVLWLTGVDYFSTLGYQPGLALLAAGALSPLATAILVGVTLLGALPVYSQVAARSYAGQGSIAMLEHLLPGWSSKIFVLILLGFATTDFVITMTLSAADAAQHAVENPILSPWLHGQQVGITLILLALLAIVFLKGFSEAINLAMAVAVPYIVLNCVVLARGVWEIFRHPEALSNWTSALALKGDWTSLLLASALVFPRLALGMSGFETGVSVMPLIRGGANDSGRPRPDGVISSTRKLLMTAAVIMSLLLIASSFVTAILIPESDYRIGGQASGRAIAFLAHRMLGETFGSIYDFCTIIILWFAGASAMAGLLNLIPRYLPRFGMAPRWAALARPLVLILFGVDVIVTLVFDAKVEAQGGAYATGVLVLILSASVAVSIAFWQEAGNAPPDKSPKLRLLSISFWGVSAIFTFTLIDNVIERPDGVIISSFFIVAIIGFSALSRAWRSIELRVSRIQFADDASREFWHLIKGKKVHLVPLRTGSHSHRKKKAQQIRSYYRISGPIAFIHVTLLDNRSEFISPLELKIKPEGENYVIEARGAIAIANTIAYISELIDPISIFLGLTRRNLVTQSLRFLLLGEGETGLMVYAVLLSYWEWTPEDDVRPLIFLMSE
jgi:hypothetical protein